MKRAVTRKKDKARYLTDMIPVHRPGYEHWGFCYVLEPYWDGRTHYKTVKAFEKEFELG